NDQPLNYDRTPAPPIYLHLDQQQQLPNYPHIVITAKSVDAREKHSAWLAPVLREQFPAARTPISRLENGPPVGYPVQV
ncbi:hypothetical protein AAHH78_41175, partial [Burkholderia pseudomallei]